MGGLLTQIFGGGLGSLVKDVVGTFHMSPDKKAEWEKLIAENEQAIRIKEFEYLSKQQDYMSKEIETASANIRAEAASGDKFTSRSRPMFMYVIYIIISWNFIILPIIQLAKGMATQPIELPTDMYWLFGCGYLGYTGFRSLDKTGFQWNKKGGK